MCFWGGEGLSVPTPTRTTQCDSSKFHTAQNVETQHFSSKFNSPPLLFPFAFLSNSAFRALHVYGVKRASNRPICWPRAARPNDYRWESGLTHGMDDVGMMLPGHLESVRQVVRSRPDHDVRRSVAEVHHSRLPASTKPVLG